MQETNYNAKYLWTVCIVAALGGLLFGYDWVVIGGAKPFFVQYFGLENSPGWIGWAMSSALLGCVLGSVMSGLLSDKFGRKLLLILAGILFTGSAVGTALAGTYAGFVLYRILGGIGIGLASNLSPVYISEVSPEQVRGRFVSVYQLAIVSGIVAAQVTNWAISQGMPEGITDAQLLQSWYGRVGWRWMFGAEAIPAFLFFAMMFFMPESPRWLVKNGKDEDARSILGSVVGDEYAEFELRDIRETVQEEIGQVNFSDLLEPRVLKIISVGVVLAVIQQWCGSNVIFYYAENVFSSAGYNLSGIMQTIVFTGLVNLVFTVAAMYTVDWLGRRWLMLVGCMGLCIFYTTLGTLYHFGVQGVPVLITVLVALSCYAFSLAPVVWVLLSELFPNRIRGAAMAISVFALWTANWALTQLFPIMDSSLGIAGSFWIFGGICAASFIYLLIVLPETKGKTLEDIERELVD